MIPGEYFIPKGDIEANVGRRTNILVVVNTGDRPVQIGSHVHFFEINPELTFNREQAFGMRLNIPAGTAVRFEPGEEKTITLVALGGHKKAFGMNKLVNGDTTNPEKKEQSLRNAELEKFKNSDL